jgi:hypothetical protein
VKSGEGMLMVNMSVGSHMQSVNFKVDLESDEVVVYAKSGSKVSNGYDFKRSYTYAQSNLSRNVTFEVN